MSWAICPISQELMRMPVILGCGHSFDKEGVDRAISEGVDHCPTCRSPFFRLEMGRPPYVTNFALKSVLDVVGPTPEVGETETLDKATGAIAQKILIKSEAKAQYWRALCQKRFFSALPPAMTWVLNAIRIIFIKAIAYIKKELS